ncbi:hypothetical protein [Bartonella massiliensis]|uniref:hypothetical protein n=1 Tax=Bartonella massiliensis TaxID=929795 RepID=UPI00115B2037|nr:hypothetical protein [Bartonella massiliensis]
MPFNGLFLLLFVLVCILAVGLAFLYRVAKRRGVTRWMFFGRWVVFYGVMTLYLGFAFAGVGSGAVSGALLLKGAVFSCMFATVLGVMHLGFKSLPVAFCWVVKAMAFCCLMGGILWLFAVGVRDTDSIGGIFLKVFVFAVLLKLLLGFFIRAHRDTVLQRVLRVLNFVLFIYIWVLVIFFAFLGAERLGWSWLWFSNQDVSFIMRIILFLFIDQAMKSACVIRKAFLKKVVGL